jgi:hypothetical protein
MTGLLMLLVKGWVRIMCMAHGQVFGFITWMKKMELLFPETTIALHT